MSANQAHARLLVAAAAIVLLVFAFGRRNQDHPDQALPAAADHSQLVLRRNIPLAVTTASRPTDAAVPARPRPPAGPEMSSQQLVKIQPSSGQPSAAPIPALSPRVPASGPPPVRAVRYHRVVEGDTLPEIARQYLGSADRFVDVFEANRDVLTRPDLLPLGVRLVIPPRLVPVPRVRGTRPVPEVPHPSPPPTANRELPAVRPAVRVLSDRELLPVPP